MLAWEELNGTANFRHQSARVENKQDFVNSIPSARNSNKYKSPWSQARLAWDHLKIKWEVNAYHNVGLCVGEELVKDRHKIFRNITNFLRNNLALSL